MLTNFCLCRMTSIVLLLACLTTAVSPQLSLTTTYANNGGGAAGGAVYFTLSAGLADVTITALDINLYGVGQSGAINLYTTPGTHVGNEMNAAVWTLVSICRIASSNPVGTPSSGVLSVPVTIPAGTSVGVAYVTTFSLAQAYSTGTAPFPLTYTGCALTLDAGSASNVPFVGALFVPRVVNTTLYYTAAGGCAQVEAVGSGCVKALASAYELTTLDQFAVNNTMTGIDFINTGGGYAVMPATGSMQPVGSLEPAAVAVAGVGDDSVNPVGTLGLVFGSNGWLATGSGNTTQWSPTPALFLNQAAEQFSCWSDFQPNAGGAITYEELGTQALLTFDQVFAWGTTDVNTFQFAYDTATGDCSLYFGAMASASAHPMMIGYSPAGPNDDPGSVGIEAALAASGSITMAATDVASLQLESMGRPQQLAVASDWDVTTYDTEATALLHVGVVGLSNPNLPLSIVGFPGSCTLYASADALVGPDIVTGLSPHTWTVLTLPASSSLFTGFEIYAQGVTLDATLQTLAARASNGIKGTVGTL